MAYVTHTVQVDEDESFQGLADDACIQFQGPPQEAAGIITLVSNWLYCVGDRPWAKIPPVKFHAQGTKIVTHIIPNEESLHLATIRVVLLEGSVVHVSKLDGSNTRDLTDANTFLDVEVNKNTGAIIRWNGPNGFDRDTTEGSEGIMDEVDAARAQLNVP